jgi:hypothetical protein
MHSLRWWVACMLAWLMDSFDLLVDCCVVSIDALCYGYTGWVDVLIG